MKTCTASGSARRTCRAPCELDLEHDGRARRGAPLELRAQRPVAAPGVRRVLDELAGVARGARTPRRRGSGSRRRRARPARGGARRGRDAQLELGQPLAQRPDQRALAHPRRAGDDEDLRHGGGGDCVAAALLAQERDELGALALREAADRLARRDPAGLQHLVRLDAPVLRAPPAAGRRPSPWRGSPGASRSSPSMDTRPPLRSRLSCARRVRISFARWSASMRWWRLRSGAATCLVGEFMAGGMGRRVYTRIAGPGHVAGQIRLHLDLRSRVLQPGRGCERDLQGFPRHLSGRARGRRPGNPHFAGFFGRGAGACPPATAPTRRSASPARPDRRPDGRRRRAAGHPGQPSVPIAAATVAKPSRRASAASPRCMAAARAGRRRRSPCRPGRASRRRGSGPRRPPASRCRPPRRGRAGRPTARAAGAAPRARAA